MDYHLILDNVFGGKKAILLFPISVGPSFILRFFLLLSLFAFTRILLSFCPLCLLYLSLSTCVPFLGLPFLSDFLLTLYLSLFFLPQFAFLFVVPVCPYLSFLVYFLLCRFLISLMSYRICLSFLFVLYRPSSSVSFSVIFLLWYFLLFFFFLSSVFLYVVLTISLCRILLVYPFCLSFMLLSLLLFFSRIFNSFCFSVLFFRSSSVSPIFFYRYFVALSDLCNFLPVIYFSVALLRVCQFRMSSNVCWSFLSVLSAFPVVFLLSYFL